jgi:PAS domain S-box-containing protein
MSHSEQPSHDRHELPAGWFPAILDSVPDPVIVVDGDLAVRACNTAAGALVGRGADCLVGRSLRDLAELAELIDLLPDGAGALENGTTPEIALRDGLVFAPQVSALRSADGAIAGWVFVLRDISLVKRIHGSMSDFLGTVSHDLRSPLTFMRGYVDMLGMVGDLNERQEGFAGKIADGITQMADIVEKVLEAGKLDPETGNYQLVREATDLHEMVRHIAGEFAEAAARKRLGIQCSIADDVPVVSVDRAMLRSAFTNLVENAVKYTPDQGRIEIDLWREDRQVLFRVSDDGFGIRPEDQARLFERHVRVHRKEWKRIKGSGLGLFIVRSVARRHGGDAWVQSEVGAGSSFYVAIPLTGANLPGAPST